MDYFVPIKKFDTCYEDVGALMDSKTVTTDGHQKICLIDIIMDDKTYVDRHWHDWLEFCYVEDGEFEITIDEKTLTLYSGDLLMINFGLMHSLIAKKKTHLLSFQISCQYLVENVPWFDPSHILCYSRAIASYQEYQNYAELIKTFQEMTTLFKKQDEVSLLGYQGKLYTFIYQLQTIFQKDQNIIKNRSFLPLLNNRNDFVVRIIFYINSHYQDNLTLEDLADEFHVSPQYISKVLKKELSMTYRQYLNIIRLKSAKYFMFHSNKNITDIAYECGFPNVHSFIDLFKKCYGMTPKKYSQFIKGEKNENY